MTRPRPLAVLVDSDGFGTIAEVNGKELYREEKCDDCGHVKKRRRFVFAAEARRGPGDDEVAYVFVEVPS